MPARHALLEVLDQSLVRAVFSHAVHLLHGSLRWWGWHSGWLSAGS